jgi:SAM-dependent methyltransferase
MSKVFGNYSKYYDAFYRTKDYNKECETVERLLLAKSKKRKRLLDLGCGTGSHAVILARNGWDVTGIDISADMLSQAKAKAKKEKLPIVFHQSDISAFELSQTYDAAISMFAVVGYLTKNSQLDTFFATVRRHLVPGAPFIFDTWFGPAVLHQRPSDRFSILTHKDERVVRMVTPRLDSVAQTVDVNYTILSLKGKKLVDEVKEVHTMRYFFAQEVQLFLNKNGFILEKVVPFGKVDGTPDENDWNVTFIARATA